MRKRILVVDDEPQITRIVSMILRASDAYEVETCNDPLEAYAKAVTTKYDLLILDIQMPLAGDQLYATIQMAAEDGQTTFRPNVLLMSGAVSNQELIKRHQDVSSTAFLMKPFHPGTLQRMVSTLLLKRPVEQSAIMAF